MRAPERNPVPLTVTAVPPAVGPDPGVTFVTVGVGGEDGRLQPRTAGAHAEEHDGERRQRDGEAHALLRRAVGAEDHAVHAARDLVLARDPVGELDARRAASVIPAKPDRVRPIPCDFAMYGIPSRSICPDARPYFTALAHDSRPDVKTSDRQVCWRAGPIRHRQALLQ